MQSTTTGSSSTSTSTLYPKITTHISEVLKTLRHQNRIPERSQSGGPQDEIPLSPIPIIGTIKLHGTHADILITPSNTITLQSRNNSNLLPTADNHEFAATMMSKQDTMLRLRDMFVTRWKELNPGAQLDEALPVTIAGEWIGTKIQKHVAISRLSKRLVIISTKINGQWVPDSDYAAIEAAADDIYNISRGGIYHSILDPSNPQTTITELKKLAEKVAARCPFAATFGVEGEGEGLVWKLVPYMSDSSLWFKTKGGRFKPTYTPAPKKLSANSEEKREAALGLAKAWVSEQRLEQGWDYLREKGIPRDMKGIGEFLKWVQLDVLAEEKGYIGEHRIDEGILRQAMIGIAKPWYLRKVAEG
ncbi:hypothetical protein K458DRAFT_416147 [Lentithecium fluviatile CBS 122367]|uniref:Uncharacterized protein n=1 Tax=Lentithecium fluviatile CBS 122367 TaxID=1168545 RepID=A0A6G1J9B1_9PLEO|nr:hypothetical protein K458DRAFT_416147 [Lentithecium fluviatile CBS 122367]